MKNLTVLLLTFCCWFNLFSQSTNPKFIPPSPDTYSLGKYGDIPVSLYTGIPDISIPIYTIKEKDIEIPISISYYEAGIKVTSSRKTVAIKSRELGQYS